MVKAANKLVDLPPEAFASMATSIRNAKVKQLPEAAHEDMITIMEAVQAYIVSEWDRLEEVRSDIEAQRAKTDKVTAEIDKRMKLLNLLPEPPQPPALPARLHGRLW